MKKFIKNIFGQASFFASKNKKAKLQNMRIFQPDVAAKLKLSKQKIGLVESDDLNYWLLYKPEFSTLILDTVFLIFYKFWEFKHHKHDGLIYFPSKYNYISWTMEICDQITINRDELISYLLIYHHELVYSFLMDELKSWDQFNFYNPNEILAFKFEYRKVLNRHLINQFGDQNA